mmetsp:Transcript_14978/g.20666  ORF Transcript_14978/g.20666 Transcript_14978/m.20666 type:complete len:318 (+) Transcript_14978:2-955(+)
MKVPSRGGSSSRQLQKNPDDDRDSSSAKSGVSGRPPTSSPFPSPSPSPIPDSTLASAPPSWEPKRRSRPMRTISQDSHLPASTPSPPPFTTSMATELEELPALCNLLTSKDWSQRSEGLSSIQDLVLSCPYIPEAQLVSMFDHLVQRLSDGNSKVNLQCLQVLTRIFPALGESTSCCINTLVPALVANLGSTNEKIRTCANQAVDTLISHMDSASLVQNFAHCVRNGGPRSKQLMLEKLTTITPEVYLIRPQLVVKYVLPAAFSLLNETKGEIRTANIRLLQALWKTMGPSLQDHTQTLSASLQQRFNEAIAIVKNY